MLQLDIGGVNRSRKVRTTSPHNQADRHPELVNRQSNADGPHQMWVIDITYVPT